MLKTPNTVWPPLLNERAEMLQNGKVVARFVCVLVRRAGLALCVVSSCARCGVFARCRVGVPASSWSGPQIGIYSLGAPIHYLSQNYVVNFTARPRRPREELLECRGGRPSSGRADSRAISHDFGWKFLRP